MLGTLRPGEPNRSDAAPDASKRAQSLAPGARIPVGRYRLVFRMAEDLRLPEFAGSLLRGQFGATLRRASCVTGAPTCAGCPVLSACAYPQIFETPPPAEHRLQKFSRVPNPYVIEPPPFGTRSVARRRSARIRYRARRPGDRAARARRARVPACARPRDSGAGARGVFSRPSP
ncbi:MAG: hypothetical protein RML56_12215 [Burkholderiales bacterium]|nr:hypothetical protein [Burkholderiales bacterium]